MFTKTITTQTRDKFGALAEIEKHRDEAAKTLAHPEHIGTSSTSEPDPENPGEHVYTIASTWKEGPPPEPEA